ncbi:MAG: HDOD domain-containing protein, partial [Thiomicrorhabdus sp.]|nr:HDOD domain-containing protein [Thiomicrorhabdus sp.]
MTEQQTFYDDILADLENGTLMLPTLPEVALKVREVVDEPDVTAAQLAEIIITDAALSTRLLKVANSALYRGRIPTETIQNAVSRLGLTLVRNLVTSLVMEQMFQATSNRLDKRLHILWEHSREVSALSQVLASKQAGIKNDEAMLAGLIHNIGVLPILMKAEEIPGLLQNSALLDTVIEELYPRIGAAILKSWKFSDEFIAVAAEHNNLDRNTGEIPDLVDIVQIANIQSYLNTDKALDSSALENVQSFKKLNIAI